MSQKNQESKAQKIKKIISNHLGITPSELTESADLRHDLNAEEIEIADLLAKLEKEFAIHLTPEEARGLKTVGDIIDFFPEA